MQLCCPFLQNAAASSRPTPQIPSFDCLFVVCGVVILLVFGLVVLLCACVCMRGCFFACVWVCGFAYACVCVVCCGFACVCVYMWDWFCLSLCLGLWFCLCLCFWLMLLPPFDCHTATRAALTLTCALCLVFVGFACVGFVVMLVFGFGLVVLGLGWAWACAFVWDYIFDCVCVCVLGLRFCPVTLQRAQP